MARQLVPQIEDQNLKYYLEDRDREIDTIPRIPQIITVNTLTDIPASPVIGQRLYIKTAVTGFSIGFYTYVNNTDRWIQE